MSEITVPSGSKVVINVGGFEDTIALKNAIIREASKNGALGSLNFSSDISKLASLAALVDSSPEVYAAIWPCLSRCTYDGEKITKKTFEPVEARKDFYDIVIECVKVNVTPFFESVLSKFKDFQATLRASESQK